MTCCSILLPAELCIFFPIREIWLEQLAFDFDVFLLYTIEFLLPNFVLLTLKSLSLSLSNYPIFFLQEKGSDEIVLKAMGRAINKTVMIAELIKVGWQCSLLPSLSLWELFIYQFSPLSEKDCWSTSKYFNWINWYNWHVGATRRRPSSVWNITLFCYQDHASAIVLLYMGAIIFLFCFSLETTRHVSMITITFSKRELDTSSTG